MSKSQLGKLKDKSKNQNHGPNRHHCLFFRVHKNIASFQMKNSEKFASFPLFLADVFVPGHC